MNEKLAIAPGRHARGAHRLVVGILCVALLAVLGACAEGSNGGGAEGGLSIEDPWVRAAMEGGNTAAYMRIDNAGGEADRLVGATFADAERVEIHETVMDGDVASMVHMPDGLDVPADGEVVLQPGGYHVMIMGLSSPLEDGDTAAITLQFEVAGDMDISAPVRTMNMDMDGMGDMGGQRGDGE